MRNSLFLTLTLILFIQCKKESVAIPENKTEILSKKNYLINQDANTVYTRFNPPEGFSWVEEKPNSFGHFLVHFPLKKYGSPVLKYDNQPITTQNLHEAVYDIDVGKKDLQQCADAVMRLRAEYLWKQKRFDEIKFQFTNGDVVKWQDYRDGVRAFVNGNHVKYIKTEKFDDSYQNFRNYLDLIFNYAGTISLTRETERIENTKDIRTGNILITPGSPGHVVFIAGVCENKNGEKRFLIGEGFTPAQSIHILSNPFDGKISPWYSFDTKNKSTKTARYFFTETNFRKF